jgi:hypothetical protein
MGGSNGQQAEIEHTVLRLLMRILLVCHTVIENIQALKHADPGFNLVLYAELPTRGHPPSKSSATDVIK